MSVPMTFTDLEVPLTRSLFQGFFDVEYIKTGQS